MTSERTSDTYDAPVTRPPTPRHTRRGRILITTGALAVDLLALCGALVIGLALRGTLPFLPVNPSFAGLGYDVIGAIVALWLLVIAAAGGYRVRLFGAGVEEYKLVTNATLTTAGLVGITCYLVQYEFSRGLFVCGFLSGIPLLVLGRYVLRLALKTARRHGHLLHRVVLAGTPSHIDEIASVLRREAWLGYQVVGALTPATSYKTETGSGIRVWGNTEDLVQVVEQLGADTVFVASGAFAASSEMRQAVWDLEEHDVQMIVAPSVTDVARERVKMRPVGGLPLVHLERPTFLAANRWAKRAFDVSVASALLLAFAPLLGFAALRVWLHDRGPILFRQTRVGQDGEEFSCLKFRSMVVDAEARLAALHEEIGHTEGLFKMTDDPRITKPGAWLRRFSIDELPQLWNVVRGDMSLVGPRPPLPSEVAAYADHMHRRLRVRPGMTGLWQVSGRSNLSWDEAIRLDLYYVDNWSLIADLAILFRTFGAVFSSDGAY